MPLTNTKVGLCNEALLLLGSKQIVSFDEGTDKATVCSLTYERTALSLMAMRSWRFATGKQQLARLATAPTNGWTYAFQLPTDRIVAPYAVYNSLQAGARVFKEFEIFGDKLYTDETVIVIDYRLDPDVSNYPAAFSQLLVYALAAKFAPAITEQGSLAEFYQELAFGTPAQNGRGGWYQIAAQADAQANRSEALQTDEIVSARFS